MMKRLNIVFESKYINTVRKIEMLIHTYCEEYLWSMFCLSAGDEKITINYMKHFWKIISVEEIPMCDGCHYDISNQTGHMDLDGCLSDDKSDPRKIDEYNEKIKDKYSDL